LTELAFAGFELRNVRELDRPKNAKRLYLNPVFRSVSTMSGGSPFRSRWRIAAILVAIAVCGYLGWRAYDSAAANAANAQGAAPPAPIPVTVAPVGKADFPVYLYGLGVVEPYDTVTVSSRVDGEITKIGFKQGQIVKAGDILAQIDPRPYQAALDQAVAKKAQDEATLKNAQHDLQRYTTLEKEDSASRQQLDTQQATVDQLTAQIKGDQASIDNAQTQLSYTTIRAPLAGKTSFRLIDPGNIVHASASTGIVTIVKLQPISVVFTAPEDDVPALNNALAAGTVPVDALSSDGLTLLSHGHLALVNNSVDQASGDIRMKATFANTDNVLWPGLSVSTRLLLDTLHGVVVVPVDAVQRGPTGLYAYVVGKDDKVEMHDIKVSQEGEKMSVVTQGLSPGENVVTEGQYRLRQGALVQPTVAPTPAPSPASAPPDTILPAEATEAAPASPVPSPAAVTPSATPSSDPSPGAATPAAKAP
jgi:multidrug efflux system membrane fusion protein